MYKRIALIISLLAVSGPIIFSQVSTGGSDLREAVRQYGQARVSVPFQDKDQLSVLSKEVSISALREKSVEVVLSPLTVEWFIKQGFCYTILKAPDQKGIITASSISQAMEWDTYPAYDQYVAIMRSFHDTYPSLCRLDTIGTSIYGKLVLALKISDNAGTDEDEPEVFYTSSIHGDETGGFVLMLHLADYLLKNYNSSSRVKNLVDNLEIWINPLSNPDGTYRTGNTISSPVRYNANGYDLNRNFPDPDYDQSQKQKETLDMMRFLRSRHFILSANFHAGEEVVNYPWDRWSRIHADDDWFHYISRKYADTVHLHSVAGYMTFLENGVTNGYDWYQINGGRQDYMTWELHGREVTIELDDYYVTPVSQLGALWEANRRSLLGYLENALYGIHGIVKNAITGAPVPARIFITGHDKDSSHVYSDTLTGKFVRMLYPGKWNLTCSAKGYMTRNVSDVVVNQGQKTDLIVEMVPSGTEAVGFLRFLPNPAAGSMKILVPDKQVGRVNIRIYNSLGFEVRNYSEETFKYVPVVVDLKGFTGGTYLIVLKNLSTGDIAVGRFVVIK